MNIVQYIEMRPFLVLPFHIKADRYRFIAGDIAVNGDIFTIVVAVLIFSKWSYQLGYRTLYQP